MKNIIVSLSLVFFLIGCATDPEPDKNTDNQVRPVVKKTNTNYTWENFDSYFPDSVSLISVSNEYKDNLNEQTRLELINYIKNEVSALGENSINIDTILTRAGCRSELIIPTYVEKAKLNNIDAWIVQYAWGLSTNDFKHYKCFAINSSSLATLYEIGCR